VTDADAVAFRRPAGRRARAAFDVTDVRALPAVAIVYAYAGADGTAVDAAVGAGARGVVVASVGRGNVPAAQRAALVRAVARGVVVVVSSRTGAGRVTMDDLSTSPGGGEQDRWIAAGDLNPQKARVLLMLALARGDDPSQIARLFASGE
jgi:L-asparaginase